jgi:hypothetical protein
MFDCCTASDCKATNPKKHRCPASGIECSEVSAKTIAHHIQKSWAWDNKDQRYFFCEDPNCDVVYFGEDESVILKSQLRTKVGLKEAGEDAPLCYCFGVSKADLMSNPGIKNFVATETKRGLCSCETSNPSGRCCLKDFPRNPDTEKQESV